MLKTKAMHETYVSCLPWIHKQCHQFIARHGGDYEEIFAEANYGFVDAWYWYDNSKGMTFLSCLRFVIWNNLLSTARRIAKRNDRLPRVNIELDTAAGSKFDIAQFTSVLSNEAKTVVELVVDSPKEMTACVVGDKKKGLTSKRSYQTRIRNHLKDALGWTTKQITDAFSEISEALL